MSQLEQMQVFIRIVEAGSISEAAKQLGVMKSLVSRRLSGLEQRLGVSLLTRTTRSMKLTEAGKEFYQRSSGILAELDELESSVSGNAQQLKGTLNIAAPISYGMTKLVDVIDGFTEANPQLKLNLSFSDSRQQLIEEGLDAAIRIGTLTDSNLRARKLGVARSVFCCAPSYLEQVGPIKTHKDMQNKQFIHYSNQAFTKHVLQTPDKQQVELHYSPSLQANNGDFLVEMCKRGKGISRLPDFIADKGIESGELVQLLPDYPCAVSDIYVVYPDQKFTSKRLRAFIDYMVDNYQ
ncbi:LysR family transcriptional regulator [Paraferrimonas sp. SM1919]|uniref:LysR family transcriptional regulator n=1 Tax=Paraferrimonas sp. SM1919 TaxID=2662263 RepID=UPI0013D0F2FE|nr:LysR family transcriptional regulator [Paraferrimonas sp. SM1919]